MTVEYEHNFSMETGIVSARVSDLLSDGSKKEYLMNLMSLGNNVNVRLMYYLNLCYRLQRLFEIENENFQKEVSRIQGNLIEDTDIANEDREIIESRFLTQQALFFERFDVQELAVCNGTFLKTYALFEDVLNQICIIYENVFEPGYNYLDLEGAAGIVRAKNIFNRLLKSH